MAGQVGKLTLKAVIDGFEDVQGLGKALQQVNVAAGKTDYSFKNAARKVKDFAAQGNNSINSIKGQIAALDKLRQSATIGGNAYKSLTRDIGNLNTQLLDLSNLEKAAKRSVLSALPDRDSKGRLVGDQRVGGSRSLNVVRAGLFPTDTPSAFSNQIIDFNNSLKGLKINTDDYNKIFRNLIENTRQYNNTLNNTNAINANVEAMSRVRESRKSAFTIGTSSQGYNPYTTFAGFDGSDLSKAGRPFIEGLPVQGPFGIGPKREAYMKRPGPVRMFEAFMESSFPKGRHSAFREALNEPLVPPMAFGPGGIGSSYGQKGPIPMQSLKIPETFAKSMTGFDQQISAYTDVLKDLTINSDERISIADKLKKVEQEKENLLKAEVERLKRSSKKPFRRDVRAGAKGSEAAQGLSVSPDGTFIGQPGPRTPTGFQAFKAPEVKKVAKSVNELTDETLKNTAAQKGSINALTKQRAELEKLRGNLDPTSATFARLTKEIAKTDKALLRLSNNKFSGQNLRRTGQSILGAGFVGGPAGFLGAGLGAGIEALRPGGDMAGGAITGGLVASQVLTPVSQAIGGSTEYASQIEKAQIALRGITKTSANYEVAQAAINKAINEYNVPQEVAIRGMTRLSAAVLGAGGNIHNATEAFLNTTVAIKGTAGSADDVKSAITAMVQIFSKGKVSAEELSGQLGERFPAAVTKFAKANNISTQELQKNLKDGTVGLDMLSKFIKSLGDEYAPLAKKIAESNEEAGARSQIAMNKMKIAVGNALRPIGADFQIIGAQLLTDLIPAIESLALIGATVLQPMADLVGVLANNFELLSIAVGLTAGAFVGLAIQQVVIAFGALNTAIKAATVSQTAFNAAILKNPYVAVGAAIAGLILLVARLGRQYKKTAEDIKESLMGKATDQIEKELKEFETSLAKYEKLLDTGHWRLSPENIQRRIDNIKKEIDVRKDYLETEKALNSAANKAKFPKLEKTFGEASPFVKFAEDLDKFDESLQNVAVNGFKKLEDTILQFAQTGKLAFKDLVSSIISDLTRLMIRQNITKPLFSMFTSLFSPIKTPVDPTFGTGIPSGENLLPGSFGITKSAMGNTFARNGIVPYAKGGVIRKPTVSLMGEQGAEAILPLQRGRGGRLGVAMQGGGGGTTNVNYTGPTLNFNGDEYLPKSAVGDIISAAAARGESKTISSLKNSRGRRASLGL